MENQLIEIYERRWKILERAGFKDPFHNMLAESIEYARSLVGAPAGCCLLDVGAGMGEDSLWFAKAGATVYAIDLVDSGLKIIKRRVAEAGLKQKVMNLRMRGEVLGFRDNCFDVVFVNAVFMHMNRAQLLAEMYRVLKPGGRVIFHEPLRNNLFAALYRYLLSEFSTTRPCYFKYREWRAAEKLFALGRSSGFFLLSMLFMPLFTRFKKVSRIRSIYTRSVKAEARVLTRIPSLQRFCWIFVGELVKSP